MALLHAVTCVVRLDPRHGPSYEGAVVESQLATLYVSLFAWTRAMALANMKALFLSVVSGPRHGP